MRYPPDTDHTHMILTKVIFHNNNNTSVEGYALQVP